MQKFTSVPFQNIDLDGGFWHERQKLNSSVSINAVYEQFKNTGRFEALRLSWKEGMPNQPHIFYDSDVAKWVESAAFILEKEKRPDLEAIVDEIVDLIEEHQEPSGYFNSWFMLMEPETRFQRRTEHELYCAGHLFEAAVAYYKATGKDKFLKLMCKYADHIEEVFKINHSAAFYTPGHEEIELALVKMYEVTGEKRYLDLSKHFIDERGTHKSEESSFYGFANARYAQDHLPVREQTTAEGHSVRAMYLCSAMADIALHYGDEALYSACQTIFNNVVEKRMYITGGVGSSRIGEAFTIDYDLQNATAYTESCAALSLALFARRMAKLELNSIYADIVERVIYNGFLSSTSLDGKRFFYENPLEIDIARIGRDISVNNGEVLPITERLEVFTCSCCPPNITRFVASIADFLYTHDESRLFVHQFMSGTGKWTMGGKEISVRQQTNYPTDGVVRMDVTGAAGMTVGVRIPAWCKQYTLKVDDVAVECAVENGYAMIPCNADLIAIVLDMDMPPVLMEANGNVHADIGKVALMRGPIVYCIEAVDNPKVPLYDLWVDCDLKPEMAYSELYKLPVITVAGWARVRADKNALYQPLSSTFVPQRLTFIPYYAFANRGESDMQVWVNLKL